MGEYGLLFIFNAVLRFFSNILCENLMKNNANYICIAPDFSLFHILLCKQFEIHFSQSFICDEAW